MILCTSLVMLMTPGLDESIHGEHAYEETPEPEHDLIHAEIR